MDRPQCRGDLAHEVPRPVVIVMAPAELSSRARWHEEQGRSFLALDLSRATPEESLALLAEIANVIKDQEWPVHVLIDATEAAYEPGISNKWKALWMQQHAKIAAIAIYGSSGIVGLSMRSYVEAMVLLGLPQASQKMRFFPTRAAAMTWLVKKD